jgi:hypothetical protein
MAVLTFDPSRALAAGAAYQVDTAEVSEPGSCKVESWASFATNSSRDFVAAVSPSCVVDPFHPLELSAQFTRSRSADEWGTAVTPKVKANIVKSAIGKWGVASYDLITKENTGYSITVPATLRLSNNLRVNVNAAYQRDRVDARDFFAYGAGFDLRTSDNVWTLTGEVFGQIGRVLEDERKSLVHPRWQLGVRYRPVDEFNVDLIYGRNLTGENANWLTIATIIRFKPTEK